MSADLPEILNELPRWAKTAEPWILIRGDEYDLPDWVLP